MPGRIGDDFHPFRDRIHAGRDHAGGRKSLAPHFTHLHKADAAGADLVGLFQITKRGNVNARLARGFQHRAAFGRGDFHAVDLDIYSFHAQLPFLIP